MHGCQAADQDEPDSIPDAVLAAVLLDLRRLAQPGSEVRLSRKAIIPSRDIMDVHGACPERLATCSRLAMVGLVDVNPSREAPRGQILTVAEVPLEGEEVGRTILAVHAWPLAEPACGWSQVVFEEE